MAGQSRRIPRLIEVDFPIRAVSDACREGRGVQRGSITPIHIWWARKPLASSRASVLAAALLDPAAPECPDGYRQAVGSAMVRVGRLREREVSNEALREALLGFVADVAAWGPGQRPELVEVARDLARAAHEEVQGTGVALVADPFAGGGALPLEGLRLGCSAYASDLNPVAVLINQVTLHYLQRHGEKLLHEVDAAGEEVERRLRGELVQLFPPGPGGDVAAYLWFRTLRCEGPGCRAIIPLTSKFHLQRSGSRSTGLRLVGWDAGRPRFEIAIGALASFPEQTVRRGSAVCLACGFTHPVERVRAQLMASRGGVDEAFLAAVVTAGSGAARFRVPTALDLDAARRASEELRRRAAIHVGELALVPDEPLPPVGTIGFRVQRYGMLRWGDLFTPRQLLLLTTLARLISETRADDREPNGLGVAVRACLALALDRVADYSNTGCSWNPSGGSLPHLFTRQALPIIWDFGEANPFGSTSGSWRGAVAHVLSGLRNASLIRRSADVERASACHHPLPSDSVHLLITDPPYYDAIPYADLSEFFYVWLRRAIRQDHPDLFARASVPRDEECIVNPAQGKDRAYFRARTTEALAEARRVTHPEGVAVIIFAHKSTHGWEELLQALVDAGWMVTASWPVDTENAARLRAKNSAALGSSVHLICRPRRTEAGTSSLDAIGSWRSILAELPSRIGDWLPRLAREGIVGADAIFACLGPALEIYSRYSRVEKASGEQVGLREYLEQIWAAVARQALSMIFEGADASGLEEDARVTAMWLWTLRADAGPRAGAQPGAADGDDEDADEEPAGEPIPSRAGFGLEFDAARKIAQGLGAHLDKLIGVVEVRGDKARLLGIDERARYLFEENDAPSKGRPSKSDQRQPSLFDAAAFQDASPRSRTLGAPAPGRTTLDRVHQAMILFGAGRSEAVKQFIVGERVGRDSRFWKLSQSLSALYPAGSAEKRWVDGVLARKVSLGF